MVVEAPRTNSPTRDAILDAVDRLLARTGFRETRMEDIAREAECSRRAIYTYFPSKEEVGLSSIDRVVERTHAHLRALAASHRDPTAALRAMLVERVLFRVDSVHDYRHSLDELFEFVRPAYMVRRRQHLAAEAEIFAAVLTAGRARFVFDDAMATAVTLIRATNAFLPYSLSVEELGARARIAADAERMADLLLRGLRKGSTR